MVEGLNMIYILLFFIFAFSMVLDLIIISQVSKKIICLVMLIGLILVSGMRWNVGPDWDSYYFFFVDYEQYRDGVYINMLEPGYTLLNGLVRTVSDNYTFFLFFIALLTIGIKFFVFIKHIKIIFVIIFFYYCYYLADVSSVRQFTSLSFTLLSSIYIVKKKPFAFIILVAIASTIHISCIAFFGAYWIYHQKINDSVLITILIISFMIGFLNISEVMMGKLISLMGNSSVYAEKLLKYSDSGIESANSNPYLSFVLGAVKRAIIIPLLFYFKNKIDPEDQEKFRGYLNLLVVGNVIYFLFIISFPEVTRLSVSYLYFEIFLLALVLVSIKDLMLRFCLLGIMIVFGAFRLYSFMAPFLDLYVPYKTFLSYL